MGRDEIRTLSAKDRYLNRKTWENQCICLCLEQLIDRNESNNSVTFKNGMIALLKSLARKHRLFIIHLLPRNIIATLNEDKPYEKSQYEKNVIQLFEANKMSECGLPTHK